MGKPTGFMEYKREDAPAYSVKERIKNFDEFHDPLSKEDQAKTGCKMHGLRRAFLSGRNADWFCILRLSA